MCNFNIMRTNHLPLFNNKVNSLGLVKNVINKEKNCQNIVIIYSI